MPPPLLVATRNRGKLRELAALLRAVDVHLLDLDAAGVEPSAAEDGLEVHDSFEANALAKARYYYDVSGGTPTLADDSGLEVDVLGGAPGVHSRRWSGTAGDAANVDAANNALLLTRLAGTGARAARFTCVVAYVDATRELVCRGEVRGRIAYAARGVHGFGYDSLFEADELNGRTFAEATGAEKHAVSHRGRALAALAEVLGDVLGARRC